MQQPLTFGYDFVSNPENSSYKRPVCMGGKMVSSGKPINTVYMGEIVLERQINK